MPIKLSPELFLLFIGYPPGLTRAPNDKKRDERLERLCALLDEI
jgi:hypothetical protein